MTRSIAIGRRSHRSDELDRPMLQFGAALVVTSIPFFVNGMDSLSRNRDPLRGRNARRYARKGPGDIARADWPDGYGASKV